MDFAKLDLRSASERGSWVRFVYDGKPCGTDEAPSRVRVRGMGAEGVLEAFRRVERVQALQANRMARASDAEADATLAKFQAELEAAMSALIVAAVAEWENVNWEDKPLPCTPDNVLKICGPGTLWFGQVNTAITDQHRLFTKADTAS